MVDDNPSKVKVSFKSHSLQSDPNSISSTQLDIHSDSILVGIVNTYDDILSNNFGMTKQVALSKTANVKILITSNNSIKIM